jgi:hypothetical protein
MDWTSTSLSTSTGDSGRSSTGAFAGFLSLNCAGQASHLYCLEN